MKIKSFNFCFKVIVTFFLGSTVSFGADSTDLTGDNFKFIYFNTSTNFKPCVEKSLSECIDAQKISNDKVQGLIGQKIKILSDDEVSGMLVLANKDERAICPENTQCIKGSTKYIVSACQKTPDF